MDSLEYKYESFQSTLPSTLPAGWNDPPPLANNPTPNSSDRRAQLRRRPVDPSCQGVAGYGAAPQNQAYGSGAGYPPGAHPQNQQQQVNYNSPASGHAMGGFNASTGGQPMQQQYSQYPGHASQNIGQSQQQHHQQQAPVANLNNYRPSDVPAQGQPALAVHQPPVAPSNSGNPSLQSNPLSAPIVGNAASGLPQNFSNQQQQQYSLQAQYGANVQHIANNIAPTPLATMTQPSQQPGNPGENTFHNQSAYNTSYGAPPAPNAASTPAVNAQQTYNPQQMYTPSQYGWGTTPANQVPPQTNETYPVSAPLTQSLESNPANLVFSPPNTVDDGTSSFAQQYDNFRVPIKAAGDVSLSGPQLVRFLTKASIRLPRVKCEGVQLRLRVLEEMIQHNKISEGCLKKLNFVVDAIDRQLYDEASNYFEQLQQQFPQEIVSWGQGLRLLIVELKTNIPRIVSAGPYGRTQ